MKLKLLSLFLLVTLLFSLVLSSCEIETTPAVSTTAATTVVTTVSDVEKIVLPTFKDDEAYILDYTSKGDGTCYVSGILVNPNYSNQEYTVWWSEVKNDFELVIPEKSPEGDTVTGIAWGEAFESIDSYFPAGMITKESFENILKDFESKGISPDDYTYRRFRSWFVYFDASLAADEEEQKEINSKYPITKYIPVYVLDRNISMATMCWIVNTIREVSSYEIDTPNIERQKFIKLLTDKGVSNAESWFSQNTDSDFLNMGIYISSVSLPDTIETIDDNVFNNTNIKEIIIPSTVKRISKNAFNSDVVIYSLSTDENSFIYNQTFNFDCTVLKYSESEPDSTVAYKYWRYVNGKPERWAEDPKNQ